MTKRLYASSKLLQEDPPRNIQRAQARIVRVLDAELTATCSVCGSTFQVTSPHIREVANTLAWIGCDVINHVFACVNCRED